MRVVVAGASGFIGTALRAALVERGDEVIQLVRRSPGERGEVEWDPAASLVDTAALGGVDAIVNLGGVGVGDKRWSAKYKEAIHDSRVQATGTLASAIASLSNPPKIFVSASAIGFYGDRGDETLTEESSPGPESDYLVYVTKRWEEAALQVVDARIPVAFLRFGIVLGRGGALGRLLLPFKLGVGGRMGNGRQWWSWISLEDQIRATLHIIDRQLAGGFNLTAPNPVRNKEFARSLATALRRPALVPAPKFAMNLILGPERARALAFTSARTLPRALLASGFEFSHATLDEAWPDVLA